MDSSAVMATISWLSGHLLRVDVTLLTEVVCADSARSQYDYGFSAPLVLMD